MDTEQITAWAVEGAEEAVILAMEPFVEGIVRRYPGRLADDLTQAGRLGVLEAIRRFDPTQGAAFSTFAWYWIRKRVQGEAARLMTPEGVTAWPLPDEHVEGDEGEGHTERRSVAVDEGFEEEAVEGLDLSRDYEMVRAAMDLLTEKERELVVEHYFGGVGLSVIASSHGITKQAASKTHLRALEKLQGCLEGRTSVSEGA